MLGGRLGVFVVLLCCKIRRNARRCRCFSALKAIIRCRNLWLIHKPNSGDISIFPVFSDYRLSVFAAVYRPVAVPIRLCNILFHFVLYHHHHHHHLLSHTLRYSVGIFLYITPWRIHIGGYIYYATVPQGSLMPCALYYCAYLSFCSCLSYWLLT